MENNFIIVHSKENYCFLSIKFLYVFPSGCESILRGTSAIQTVFPVVSS